MSKANPNEVARVAFAGAAAEDPTVHGIVLVIIRDDGVRELGGCGGLCCAQRLMHTHALLDAALAQAHGAPTTIGEGGIVGDDGKPLAKENN
jgi:hypothetical protein